ncbi:hypothetical protein GCM10010210_20880 [Pseudonocardia hydrocarbonoxydans]
MAGSQIALAASNYLVLAIAARHLDAAGVAVLSSYYLLINTVGRGLFAAVELETTRAVAAALAAGRDDGAARSAALSDTGLLLAGALILLGVSSPLLLAVTGSGTATVALLAVGAVAMAASYLLRGPLAGAGRYSRYAATFWIEAGVGLAAAGALVLLNSTSSSAWIAVLALAPLVSAAVLVRPGVRGGGSLSADPGRRRTTVLWSAALLLAGQGLWNLAPVLVTARLATDPEVATGFFYVAVLLRAPVLLFPAVQALLLPAFTTMTGTGNYSAVRTTSRRLGLVIAGGGVVWIMIAVLVVPTMAHLVFAATTVPPTWVLVVLALSTVAGAAAQIGQTHLLALGRAAEAASGWILGLTVLIAVGLLAAPPIAAASLGQLVGAGAVLVLLSLVRRRSPAVP